MKRTIGSQVPEKLGRRLMLVSSGLLLNKQIWSKAKGCLDELHGIICYDGVKDWPNVAISTALMGEKETGSSPLIKPCNPEKYKDKKYLEKKLIELERDCEKYNGNKKWCENDYLRLFSSPLGINHLFVGVSVHFDLSLYMKGEWGEIRRGFPLMPIVIEAQQGTWPRYFNAAKSERKNFVNLYLDSPHRHWKDEIIVYTNGNFLVAEALREALSYVCSLESQRKIVSLARQLNFKWIGFDAQFITKNRQGHQIGFMVYDYMGF
ncbi:MAG TPA: hypothetical protein ENH22_00070 [Candidatus Campbellbacteria bacterium]|nr:hypothetical protein [Candidatus Campbellbacteria bacterium]